MVTDLALAATVPAASRIALKSILQNTDIRSSLSASRDVAWREVGRLAAFCDVLGKTERQFSRLIFGCGFFD